MNRATSIEYFRYGKLRAFALDAFLCVCGSVLLAIAACWIVIATSEPRRHHFDPLPVLRWDDLQQLSSRGVL